MKTFVIDYEETMYCTVTITMPDTATKEDAVRELYDNPGDHVRDEDMSLLDVDATVVDVLKPVSDVRDVARMSEVAVITPGGHYRKATVHTDPDTHAVTLDTGGQPIQLITPDGATHLDGIQGIMETIE